MNEPGAQPPGRLSVRLTDDEIWAMVTDAHTGIMTTLRRDGMPVSLPLWFACVDRVIYVHSRGRKLQRIAHDPRASFLVESGERWAELKAVHFTGRAEVVEPDAPTLTRIEAETARKYAAFRTPSTEMPDATALRYAGMRWVGFTPDARVLSWDNAKIAGGRR
jgi:nitroimidazol reductase NimA-like FMN-containing flavoprotein (pyridoxamine 5'-phosphate oxidase superfamily)